MVLLSIVFLAFAVAAVLPIFFIFRKAGMSPFFGFLMLIPGFGFLICLSILAFSQWNLNTAEGV